MNNVQKKNHIKSQILYNSNSKQNIYKKYYEGVYILRNTLRAKIYKYKSYQVSKKDRKICVDV